jgi:hypothetical protein
VTLEEFLAEHDFELVQRGRDGSNRYIRKANPYLDLWVTAFADGTIEYTWELEFGAYLISKGFTVSVQDELSLLLFPGTEKRGPADPDWLAAEIARTEVELRSVDLLGGT